MKVSLKGYEKPLFATKCTGGYWISYEYGKFLKTDSGKIKVFDEDFILESHELYKQEFNIQYKQDLVKREAVESGTPVPMLSIKYDDKEGMDLLKSVFSVSALESVDFDMDKVNDNLQQALDKKYK